MSEANCTICGRSYHGHHESGGMRLCPVSAFSYRAPDPNMPADRDLLELGFVKGRAQERAAVIAFGRRSGSHDVLTFVNELEKGTHL